MAAKSNFMGSIFIIAPVNGFGASEQAEESADYLDDCPRLTQAVPDVAQSVTTELLSVIK